MRVADKGRFLRGGDLADHCLITAPTRSVSSFSASTRRVPHRGAARVAYQSVDLPTTGRAVYDLSLYTAEPGTAHEERLRLLGSLTAPKHSTTQETSTPTRRENLPKKPATP